ncbi:hypothetical protein P3S67_031244 [Capsicum chacoense]
MLCCQNKNNETALHIAASEGHTEVVCVLLACVEDHNSKESLTSMRNASGDTALHKAVRSQHLYVVKLLVKEDSEFEFLPNHEQETPLYLAAESGPSNRTPLHAAVIQEHKDCIRSLWRWNKPLCEEPDLWGWNSLHYAVKLGMEDVVSDMLAWKKSLVYLPAGSENDWTTAIHIAASEGDVNMIKKLLNHCSDCRNMLTAKIKTLFMLPLVDEPDSDGNTPLHLLSASDNHVRESIYHPRAKKMSFNKQNQTPLDIALSRIVTTEKEKLVRDLCSIGRFGKRDLEVKQKYEYMPLMKDDRDKAKKAYQTTVEGIMKVAQIHIVVATLIMTVTFVAGITLPRGFERDPDSSKSRDGNSNKENSISCICCFRCHCLHMLSCSHIHLLWHAKCKNIA